MSSIVESLNFIPYGDHAFLIKANNDDLMTANEMVINLTQVIKMHKLEYVIELVPATDSITVIFDTFKVSVDTLIQQIKSLIKDSNDTLIYQSKLIELPICYDPEYALDMETICEQTGLSAKKLIQTHLKTTYRIMMTGFMPGFFYLGVLPESIDIVRKSTPRKQVKKGSVGLAGRQTGIYSVNSPGGWQIIGKSVNMLDKILNENLQINLGDNVSFFEVSKKELKKILLR